MPALTTTHNDVIFSHVVIAKTFWDRLKGLMFTQELPQGQALWIKPCKSVHTFFMSFPLDVVFLSEDMRVVKVVDALPPYRISPLVRNATSVLECNAGAWAQTNLSVGDQVRLAP